jgi:uncharacterized repeat protein (TIGR03803 family)
MESPQPARHRKLSRVLSLVIALAATCALATTAHAQTEQVLYNFTPRTGAFPPAGPIFDTQGNLYGSADGGDESAGHGAVFELSPGTSSMWTETDLAIFHNIATGWNPSAGVVADRSGVLFGTTSQGGSSSTACTEGCGVVFQLAQVAKGQWAETVIHTFVGGIDGNSPRAGIILDSEGNVYGTTAYGGSSNYGMVFKLSSHGWKESILHTFTGGVDGGVPSASLVMDASGNLYGTTYSGGNTNTCPKTAGCGVVFELSNANDVWKETLLHTFTGGVDGANPLSNLVPDANGNLYGTTHSGGDLSACSGAGCGTVFELSHNSQGWKTTVIRSFGGGQDGANPAAGLIFDAAGNLYGTTEYGGIGDHGTVFELSPSTGAWNLTLLHAFTGHPDGANPLGGVVFDIMGNLYGTTADGGAYGSGAIFEITP